MTDATPSTPNNINAQAWRLAVGEGALFMLSVAAMTLNLINVAPKMGWPWFKLLTHWHLMANITAQTFLFLHALILCRTVSAASVDNEAALLTSNNNNQLLTQERALTLAHPVKFFDTELRINPRNFTLTSSVLIAALYWSLLAKEFQAEAFLYHGSYAGGALVNLIVNNTPYHMVQAGSAFAFATVYAVFAAVYSYNGGFTYPQLEWKQDPMKAAIFSVGGMVSVYVVAAIIRLLQKVMQPISDSLDGCAAQTLTAA